MTYDLLIVGGEIVTANARFRAQIGIRDGRIAALFEPGTEPPAGNTIDATGHFVLPGAVDAHVHFRDPGLTYKEDFTSGTRAAAAGGVTTVMVMPTDAPWTLTPEAFRDKRASLADRIHVDVALQAAVFADSAPIDEFVALGAVSFELFLAEAQSDYLIEDNGKLRAILQRIKAAGAIAGISPGDEEIVREEMRAIAASDARDMAAFSRSRPPVCEAIGVARAGLLAEDTGARVHIRQVSALQSIAILGSLKPRTPHLTAEITPHNLLLTAGDAVRTSPYSKVSPPLRDAEHARSGWEALLGGVIDIVATDHAPHARTEKEKGGENIWDAPGGFPGVQTFLPLLLDAAFNDRLRLEDVVRVASENPARIFNLFPRKGTVAVGGDADLVLVRDETWEIHGGRQESKAKYTPFDGRKVRGRPVMTILRGSIVMDDDVIMEERKGMYVSPL